LTLRTQAQHSEGHSGCVRSPLSGLAAKTNGQRGRFFRCSSTPQNALQRINEVRQKINDFRTLRCEAASGLQSIRRREFSMSAPVLHVATTKSGQPAFIPAWVARLMPELSYYTLVSIAALGVDLVIFNGLALGGMRPAVAGAIGYLVGMIVHYLLSARFVFDVTNADKGNARRFAEFALSGAIGLAITWGLIHLATDVCHLPAMAGKIAAVGTSFIVVFLLRRGIVFAGRRTA
jgi:putative flippase GtrA